MNEKNFYESLEGFSNFTDCMEKSNFRLAPIDWAIVVTDVINSTKAIENDKYKHVNAVAAASITALINALKPMKFPFVFGGDGASACVPIENLEIIKPALVAAKELAKEEFDLELRVGVVPIKVLLDEGYELWVAKFQPYEHFSQAIFMGGAITKAEELVKDKSQNNPYLLDDNNRADSSIFEGFECRWNTIPAPNDENVTLLIDVLIKDEDKKRELYALLLKEIDLIYQTEKIYHPVRENLLSLTSSFKLLNVESRIRTAFMKPWHWLKYILKLQIVRLIGMYLMKNDIKTQDVDWGKYKSYFVQNSDFRKFDDIIRMVISGNAKQRLELEKLLNKYKDDDKLIYGLSVSDSAQITCIVTNYDTDHIHLIDGSDGGYTKAAKILKEQKSKTVI